MKHNTSVSNIEITGQNIRAFSSTAKKYGLDFPLKKDTSGEHTRYRQHPTDVALDRKLKEKKLAALQARDEELSGLFERIYGDNVSCKLSDDRFAKMSRRYEDGQKEISEKIKTLRAETDKLSSKSVTATPWMSPGQTASLNAAITKPKS